MNSNFKVIGLARPEIIPESTASKADTISTRQSELLICKLLIRGHCEFYNVKMLGWHFYCEESV